MRALERFAAILETVAASPNATAPSQATRATGLSLSTAARLMQQMSDVDLLTRDDGTGTYTLGPRIFAVAHAGMNQFGLKALGHPLLEEARDRIGETTSLHLRAGSQRVCIDQAPGNLLVSRLTSVGAAYSLFGSATGDVLLAGAPAEDLSRLLSAAELTADQRAQVEQDISRTRRDGYSLSVNRWAQGVASVAAPVRKGGVTVGAMAASGPTDRFTPERAAGFVPELIGYADRLSAHLK